MTVIRDAIELFTAENGAEPTAPATELLEYLRDTSFPECPVGDFANPAGIEIVGTPGDLTATPNSDDAWKYSTESGNFIINSADESVLNAGEFYHNW